MLTEDMINEGHRQAVAQSGPRKGRLKANCPAMGTLGEAYWLGAMYVLNPLRVSIARLIFMPDDHRALFDLVAQETERMKRRKAAA